MLRTTTYPRGRRGKHTYSLYDDYWTRDDEQRVVDELDEWFYQKYPQFKVKSK